MIKSSLFVSFIISLVFYTGTYAQWDAYHTYDEYLTLMEKFQIDYPELCKIEEFGESVTGRKLLAAKISDSVNVTEAEPEFLYTSTIHGDELTGFVLSLRLIDYLLSNYGHDPFITRLVDSIEIWICPLLNPDGTYYGGNSSVDGARRYNANNKDLNRNFPIPYTGSIDTLEKETSAIIEFHNDHNFVMGANFFARSEGVLYPWQAVSRDHPDKEWFIHVSKSYADTAQGNSPDGYFTQIGTGGAGFDNGYRYMVRHGTMSDYQLYYKLCRNIEIWLSQTKKPDESTLKDYWEYNYKSMLNYLEQVLFGIRGQTYYWNEPLETRVLLWGHDQIGDSSMVYSHLPHGYFFRPVYAGTYDIIFSSEWFPVKTVPDVVVENNKATILDIEFIVTEINKPVNGHLFPFNSLKNIKRIEIYDLMGRKVKTLPANAKWKEGNGVYIVRFVGTDVVRRKVVYLKR